MERYGMDSATCVIPAYNEAQRIGQVLDAVGRSECGLRVIVVDDGSQDGTREVAQEYGAQVITLPENMGKGAAMYAGAVAARSRVILYLDADLVGLQPEQVDSLIRPVARGEADMAVGQFSGGRYLTTISQMIAPNISGQRCLRRDFFLRIPGVADLRSGVEVAITCYAQKLQLRTVFVPLVGVTHPMKEEKLGLWLGMVARAKMYYEIGRFYTAGFRQDLATALSRGFRGP